MRIGVPTEIKTDEYRVGMTPAGVAVYQGAITYRAVAESQSLAYTPLAQLM
ncbi:MAG TPA: hypothetical protein VER58_14815 [Thermoanaerobaculia bacterium]|nr:hypothetical protein [Thermoanaerobaculia bacterium]